MNTKSTVLTTQLAITAFVLALWEWGFSLKLNYGVPLPDFFDPYFISKPSEIWTQLLRLSCAAGPGGDGQLFDKSAFVQCLAKSVNNLWAATWVTLRNTLWGFATGVGSGFVIGLFLGRSPFMARVFEPFLVAFNSVPRIALVPLVVMIFGLGDASKIITAWLLVFFLVFFNTFEGARQVERDLVS